MEKWKQCKSCGISQPLSSFYPHPKSKDGTLNTCRSCKKNKSKKYREEKKYDPVFRENERERAKKKYYQNKNK